MSTGQWQQYAKNLWGQPDNTGQPVVLEGQSIVLGEVEAETPAQEELQDSNVALQKYFQQVRQLSPEDKWENSVRKQDS